MPVYIPEEYREVRAGSLTILKLEIQILEVAESGQRFAIFEANGAGGCVHTTAGIPQGMRNEAVVESVMNEILWTSVLLDVPF